MAAVFALVLGLDAGAARAVAASVKTPRVGTATPVTSAGPLVSRPASAGQLKAARPSVAGGAAPHATPFRATGASSGAAPGTAPGRALGTSRRPPARAFGLTPTRRVGTVGAAHAGVLGGPARYDGRQGGVLTGTGLKRRPTAPH